MHPSYVSDRLGDCPICNMALVKLEAQDQGASGPVTDAARDRSTPAEVYYCPMHPDYQSEKPGTCPICNMDLVKRGPREQSAAAPAGGGEKPATPPRAIYISPRKQQLIGVKYGLVEHRTLVHTLHTVGQVTRAQRELLLGQRGVCQQYDVEDYRKDAEHLAAWHTQE